MAYRALHFCLDTNGNLNWVTETTAPSASGFSVSKVITTNNGDLLTQYVPGYTQGNAYITSALELISSDPITGTFNVTNATGSTVVATSVTTSYSVVTESGSQTTQSLQMVTSSPSVSISNSGFPTATPPDFVQNQVITL